MRFIHFFENAFVKRVIRRIDIRTVRFWRSICDVLTFFISGFARFMRRSYISGMATTSVNLRDFGVDTTSTDKAVLTARPDMRIVKLSFLAPVLVLTASIVAYLLPVAIDPDYQLAGSVVIATIGVAGISFLLVMYEALAKAVYTVTNEHVEEEYGIIYKRLRRIPLSYVRDVTYDQSFRQGILGVSSITGSPTNGDKIVLSNIPEGESARERIWSLILSKSPREKRMT